MSKSKILAANCRNIDVRRRLAQNFIPHWLLAERLGIHFNTLSNWLRGELTEERRHMIDAAIEDILRESEGNK